MKPLRFTLCGDGQSEDMLLPIIRWVLERHLPDDVPINDQFARWFDLRVGPRPKGLAEKIRVSLKLFPCDLLVVHRDAEERDNRKKRVSEIEEAVAELAAADEDVPPHVCLVPVRMSEAWLLFDESAIRAAAGNPNGKVKLGVPKLKELERLADPKAALREAVLTASEATGRKRQKLDTTGIPRVVANFIDDFSPLRHLSAFQSFEEEVRRFAESWSAEA